MIRVIAPALRHPFHRTLLDFHRYWAEVHGPLCARMTGVRRYAQLHTLPEAYGDAPAPSYDGASMFWFDDIGPMFKTALFILAIELALIGYVRWRHGKLGPPTPQSGFGEVAPKRT